jgi:hypothetical protein
MTTVINVEHPSYRTEIARAAISRVNLELETLHGASTLDVDSLQRLHKAAKAAHQALVAEDFRQGHADNDPSPDRKRMAAILRAGDHAIAACEHTTQHNLPPAIMLETIRALAEVCQHGDDGTIVEAARKVARTHSSDAMVVLRRHLQKVADGLTADWRFADEAVRLAVDTWQAFKTEAELDPKQPADQLPNTADMQVVEEVITKLGEARDEFARHHGCSCAPSVPSELFLQCLDKIAVHKPAGRCVCDNTDGMMKALYGKFPGAR